MELKTTSELDDSFVQINDRITEYKENGEANEFIKGRLLG